MRHGIDGYGKHKCRCPLCRTAHRDAQRRYRGSYLDRMCPNCGRWFKRMGSHERFCMGSSSGCPHDGQGIVAPYEDHDQYPQESRTVGV